MSIAALISRLLGSSSTPAIEHDDMQKAVESGECHIVNVHEVNEYQGGHISGPLIIRSRHSIHKNCHWENS